MKTATVNSTSTKDKLIKVKPKLVGRTTNESNLSYLHRTSKPVDLIADAILDCAARGDIVVDLFSGSGATVIAAPRIGCACYGSELDPRYVETIVRRWQKFTGLEAVHQAKSQTFAQR